jgi:hypothetical protein
MEWIEQQVCSVSSNPPSSCPGQGGGSPPGSPARNKVRVDIFHDWFPTDTGWSIKKKTGETVTSSRAGAVNEEEVLVSTFVDLEHGEYDFEITDTHGDGLTQGKGKGSEVAHFPSYLALIEYL